MVEMRKKFFGACSAMEGNWRGFGRQLISQRQNNVSMTAS